LPGQETVPNFTLCDATTLGKIDELIFVMEGAVIGGGTPALNALCRARYVGRLANTLVTGAAGVPGDTLFVSDTGALSTAPGTLRRQVGSIMHVIGAGYYDVMIDGVGGADITPIGAPYVIFGPGGTLTAALRIDAASPTPFLSNVMFLSGAATVTPLIVKAHAAQSVNIFEIQNSAGTNYFKVNKFGVFDGVGQLSNNLGIDNGIKISWPNWQLLESASEMRLDFQARANTAKFVTDVGASGITKMVLTAPGGNAGAFGVDDAGWITFVEGGPFFQLRSGNIKVVEGYNTANAGYMILWSPDGTTRSIQFIADQSTGITDIQAMGVAGSELGILRLNSQWRIDSGTGDFYSVGGAGSPQQIWGVSDPLYPTSAVNLQTLQTSEETLKQQFTLPRRERFTTWPITNNGLWDSPSIDYPTDLAWEAQANNVYPFSSHATRGRPTGQAAGENSSLGLRVILNATSRLVFSYRTTSGSGTLKLYLDGVNVFETPNITVGDGGGMYVSDPLPAGFHKFTWRYVKTGAGADVIAITDVSIFSEQDLREVSDGFIWQDDDWTLNNIPLDSAATDSVWRWFKNFAGAGGSIAVDTDLNLYMRLNNVPGSGARLFWGPSFQQVCFNPAYCGCFIEFALSLSGFTVIDKGFDFKIFNPMGTEAITLSADVGFNSGYWTFVNGSGTRHVIPFNLGSSWHTYRICINPAGITFLQDAINTNMIGYRSMPAATESVSIPQPSFITTLRVDGVVTAAPIAQFRSFKWRGSKLYKAL
jgi:hypothetical protein